MTTTTRNLLLKALSANPRKLILRLAEPVNLDAEEHLIDANQPVNYVYFIESGSVSQVKTVDNKAVQVATIGLEGMIGVETTLDATTLKYSYICELEGQARKLTTTQFEQIIIKYPEVKDRCYSYMLALMSQMMLSFTCYVSHALEKKVCHKAPSQL